LNKLSNARVNGEFRPLKPGPGRARKEVADDQRARIEKAMIELVGLGGYESVTVRKLAALAHVSTRTFYSLFGGTDRCFLDVHRKIVENVRGQVVAARVPGLERREQARRSIRALIEALVADPASVRLITTEIFGAGPAALAPARDGEARLESGLRESLDRRGERFPSVTATWVTAGILHWARGWTAKGVAQSSSPSVDEMVRWGERVVTEEIGPTAAPRPDRRRAGSESSGIPSNIAADHEEKALLVAAASKLAIDFGYRSLNPPRISAAAGLAATAFRRHFDGVEEIYLEVARRLASRLFCLDSRTSTEVSTTFGLDTLIPELCGRVNNDPVAARVALLGVLEPGRPGSTSKATLVSRIATVWDPPGVADHRRREMTAEAAVAGLWAVLAREVDQRRVGTLPGTAPTLVRLFSASNVRARRPTRKLGNIGAELLDETPYAG
jgi:AcrR family transcriptional regulator